MTIEEALTVLDKVLQHVRLNDTQEAVFCEAWAGKTYPEIAAELNFTEEHIRAVGADLWHFLSEALGEKVNKRNFKGIIERWARQNIVIDHTLSIAPNSIVPKHQDWGEAVDVSTFFGREDELVALERWIVYDRCRLVALLGMGGMGKTSLSVKLAQQIQADFDAVVWRSLRNAPPIQELLTSLLSFLAEGMASELPEEVSEQLSLLIHYLRDRRCLIVLDNAEMILHAGDQDTTTGIHHAGHYQEGYEDYGELLRRIGEVPHQSCLILTSREKPKEIDVQEGLSEPVRSLHLRGLNGLEGQQIFKLRGHFSASEADWNLLIQHYAGNPLALKIVASTIQDLFDSDISKFVYLLNQGMLVFDDIRDLLSRQIERLPEDEIEIMYWLAINRELMSFTELQSDILSPTLKWRLPEVLKSLGRRFLIECSPKGFTQQPVVMEYLIEQLIERVCQEISLEKIDLLMSHALIKAQAKSYIRESQVRIILQPIADRLCELFKSPKNVELKLQHILLKLKTEFLDSPGYAAGNLINLMQQLNLELTGYDFSHLAVWQAYLQGVNLHEVNFAACDLSRSVFTETLGNIWTVAFSPDGKQLAAGDTVNEIHVWQVADEQNLLNPQKLLTCCGHTNWVSCLSFSPSGQILASGSADNIVKLWDSKTGQCLRSLYGHTDWVLSVAFDATGELLATGSADRTIRIWDTQTGNCLQILQEHTNWVRGVAFAPLDAAVTCEQVDPQTPQSTTGGKGSILVSGSGDDTVKLWNVYTGKCLQTITAASGGVWSIAFSPNGQLLVLGGADATVKLWNFATHQCLRTLRGHSSQVRSVAFSVDSYRVVSASEDQTIRLWDVASGECLRVLQGHSSAVWSVACSSNHRLASGSLDQRVKLWDIRTGKCLLTLQGYTDFVWATAIVPQPICTRSQESQDSTVLPPAAILASGSTDHTIKLWDMGSGQCMRTLRGHTNWVLSVAFSCDRRTLASSSFDQTIRLWDSYRGYCSQILHGHTNWVLSVAFSPDGTRLASGSFDQTVKLWDVQTGECLQTLQGHEGRLWSVTYSPNGRWVASGGDDLVVRVWDCEHETCVRILQGHTERIWSIAFSPDGETLVSGGRDQTVRLWDVHTGECLHVLTGHTNRIQSVAFSVDGALIASGSADHTIKIWDRYTGECLQTLKGHRNRVWSVAFGWMNLPLGGNLSNSDGPHFSQLLASGSEDETIRLWDLSKGECIRTLRGLRPYQGLNITGASGLTEAQKVTLKMLGAVEV